MKIEQISRIIDSIIEYIIAFLLILGTRSIYVHQVNGPFREKFYLVIILIIYILKLTIVEKDLKTNYSNIKMFFKKYYKYIIVYYIVILYLIKIHVSDDVLTSVFLHIIPLLTGIYTAKKEKVYDISKKISDIMVVLAVLSLFCYFTISIFEIFDTNTTIMINWGGKRRITSFYNIYFEPQINKDFGFTLVRNTAIFTEAPMYSMLLCIALAMEKFVLNRKNKMINFILVVTIITTISTTGLIILSLIYGIELFEKLRTNKSINKNKKIGILIMVLFLLIISVYAFAKKIETSSGLTRIDDYKAAFYAWLESPIKGIGIGNNREIVKYMSEFRAHNTGLSNSLMVLLAHGGIILFLVYFVPFLFVALYSIIKKKYNLLYFEIITLVLFVLTIFQYTTTIANLLALGYSVLLKNEEMLYKNIKQENI